MKSILLKFMKRETLSFESIYHNKGFAADAFRFSLIEPKKNNNRKKRFRISKSLKAIQRFSARSLYTTIVLFWFSFYFVVFGTIKLFTIAKL